jgi:hypothetical protein
MSSRLSACQPTSEEQLVDDVTRVVLRALPPRDPPPEDVPIVRNQALYCVGAGLFDGIIFVNPHFLKKLPTSILSIGTMETYALCSYAQDRLYMPP